MPTMPPLNARLTLPSQADPLRRSAESLEAAFLSEMLKHAGAFRPAETFGGGEGEEQFTSFLADIQAEAIVARGGIGLADSIEQALRTRMSRTAS